MNKVRHGFTLIEIALFLAVTGALFVGIIVGTQNSIWQQRYNDTVQNFTNFLRNVYSEVSNPQSLGDGRSERAIYGKLISFGQEYGLDGDKLSVDDQKFFVYDVVGDADATKVTTGTVTEMLKRLNANVVVEEKVDGNVVGVAPAGIVESYSPIWNSAIETTEKSGTADNLYKGTILIVRHPGSGTINTLVTGDVIEVNQVVGSANGSGEYTGISELLISKLDNDSFKLGEVNFCVNPYGVGESNTARRNVRIIRNARNASGVELINLDSDDDKCLD